jgi:histo-blood group ABO system transferase
VSGLKESEKPSIGVMSVATNIYFEYWQKMVQSADVQSNISDRITFFVFTEQIQKVEAFSRTLRNVNVRGFEVIPYGWPDATLLRYQIFDEQFSNMNTEALMHLDADMIFVSSPWGEVRRFIAKKQICLIQHPGFWRSRGRQKVFFYLRYPKIAIRDLRMVVTLGGIGSWETHPNSAACVPRKSRSHYFCGATWFGPRQKIGEMLKLLSAQVSEDQKNGVIAKWHDESHLNKWAMHNQHSISSPELCFDETYPQLKKLIPSIIAVRKKAMTR